MGCRRTGESGVSGKGVRKNQEPWPKTALRLSQNPCRHGSQILDHCRLDRIHEMRSEFCRPLHQTRLIDKVAFRAIRHTVPAPGKMPYQAFSTDRGSKARKE